MKKIIIFSLVGIALAIGLIAGVGAAGTILYVDNTVACDDVIGNPYCTIQAAIDDASNGDTIEVAAGTYEEQLIINKSIALQGEDRNTTIIEYPLAPVSDQYLVMVQADDVTITGFKLLGHFAVGNRAAYIVHSQGAGLIVENNEIQGHIGVFGNLINGQIRNNIIETNRKGIYVPGGNNLLIERNTIEPAEGAGSYAYNCGAIYMDHAIDVIIQGNTMRDFSSSVNSSMTAGRGIEGSHNSYITISDNTFENSRDAITMWIVTDIEIDKNTIANSDRYGINIKGQNINIINNEVTGSGDSGVNIAEFTISTQNVNVNFNNIVGNTNYGVKNQWSGEVNAENNWWGHASGPSGEDGRTNKKGKVIGKGDAVSANVDWNPWLPQPVEHTPHHPVPPGLLKHNSIDTGIAVASAKNQKLEFSLPAHAAQVAPGVFSLGIGSDNGRMVQGYAFVHYKKGFAKPGTECGNGICEPGENAKKCPADCVSGEEPDDSNCYGFLAKGAKWKDIEDYIVDPTNIRGLGETFARNNLALDINKWETAAGVDILGDEVAGVVDGADMVSPDNKNEVMFGDIDSPGAIGVTIIWGIFGGPPPFRELVEWDMIFDDADFDWSADGEENKMDFENIATHELGHAVGLGDLYTNKCSEQTMYGYASYGETKKRDLEAGDIAGISKLY